MRIKWRYNLIIISIFFAGEIGGVWSRQTFCSLAHAFHAIAGSVPVNSSQASVLGKRRKESAKSNEISVLCNERLLPNLFQKKEQRRKHKNEKYEQVFVFFSSSSSSLNSQLSSQGKHDQPYFIVYLFYGQSEHYISIN